MTSNQLSDSSSSLVPPSASSSNGNLTDAAEGIVKNKGELFASFDVNAFEVPGGRDELWRFTPLKRLRGLHDGSATATARAGISVTEQPGVTVETVGRDDERLGQAGAPTDRVAAQAYSSFEAATIVTVARGTEVEHAVTITIDGPGDEKTAYGHLQIRVEELARAIVVIDLRGSGTYADNVEMIVGDSAALGVIWIADWADDMVNVSAHHATVGRDARFGHVNVTLGGDVVRTSATVRFTAPGGEAQLLGTYFADDGQFFESRLLVDHAVPNCKSDVLYKGALQGDPESNKPDAHTVWIGDVLIRAAASNTDTFEVNRNLVLTDGARADSVPNLEIETGEIVGAGHASATGRFDDEQLFYLRARGIPEDQARRLVVRGFFNEIIAKIAVPAVRDRLTEAIERELAITAGPISTEERSS
jgi:Fe-S cluster assembly protein SufD